jgi:hypothetical protein
MMFQCGARGFCLILVHLFLAVMKLSMIDRQESLKLKAKCGV